MASRGGNSNLECPVCLTPMQKNPRALFCLHTFCVRCLERLAEEKNSVTCPTCRKETKLSEEGIFALPVNFFIGMIADQGSSIAEHKSKLKLCQICEETEQKSVPAICICNTCENQLCSPCVDHHASVAAYEGHEIEVFVPKKQRGLDVNCEQHGKNVTVYCKECRDYACDICALGPKHRGHGNDLIDSHKAYDNMLVTVGPGILTLMSGISNRLNAINAEVDKLDQIKEKIKSEVNKRMESIKFLAERMLLEISRNHEAPLLSQKKVLNEMTTKLDEMSIVIRESYLDPDLILLTQTEKSFKLLNNQFLSAAMPTDSGVEFLPSPIESQLGNLRVRSSLANLTVPTMAKSNQRESGPACTQCTKRSKGSWYRCGVCSDFCLCQDCEKIHWSENSFSHDESHVFLKMHERAKIINMEQLFPPTMFLDSPRDSCFYYCDRCSITLPGDDEKNAHYRCVMCPDYDLCENCEQKEGTQLGIHFEDHVFAKLNQNQSRSLISYVTEEDLGIPMLELKEALSKMQLNSPASVNIAMP